MKKNRLHKCTKVVRQTCHVSQAPPSATKNFASQLAQTLRFFANMIPTTTGSTRHFNITHDSINTRIQFLRNTTKLPSHYRDHVASDTLASHTKWLPSNPVPSISTWILSQIQHSEPMRRKRVFWYKYTTLRQCVENEHCQSGDILATKAIIFKWRILVT